MSASLNILVVDDDHDICEYLQTFLSSDGYEVSSVQDPTQALDACADPAVLEIHHEAFQPEIRRATLRIVAIADALDPSGDDDLRGRF